MPPFIGTNSKGHAATVCSFPSVHVCVIPSVSVGVEAGRVSLAALSSLEEAGVINLAKQD